MNRRLHLFVSGRVQGVYYRGSAVEMARRLRLTGWVRNHRDGRVELEAEGDEGSLQALLDWCRHGPALAHVEHMEVDWRPSQEAYTEFVQTPTV